MSEDEIKRLIDEAWKSGYSAGDSDAYWGQRTKWNEHEALKNG